MLWPHSAETETACTECDGQGTIEIGAPSAPRRAPSPQAEPYLRREVEWCRPEARDPDLLYVATVDGREWTLFLVGEAVPFATLVIDGEEVASCELDDWPPAWRRPSEPCRRL
jgi:hypothetical protein